MLLVINSLGDSHTHAHIQTHMHTDFPDKSNPKKPGMYLPCLKFLLKTIILVATKKLITFNTSPFSTSFQWIEHRANIIDYYDITGK